MKRVSPTINRGTIRFCDGLNVGRRPKEMQYDRTFNEKSRFNGRWIDEERLSAAIYRLHPCILKPPMELGWGQPWGLTLPPAWAHLATVAVEAGVASSATRMGQRWGCGRSAGHATGSFWQTVIVRSSQAPLKSRCPTGLTTVCAAFIFIDCGVARDDTCPAWRTSVPGRLTGSTGKWMPQQRHESQ